MLLAQPREILAPRRAAKDRRRSAPGARTLSSRSARLVPMKPAPPVMSTCRCARPPTSRRASVCADSRTASSPPSAQTLKEQLRGAVRALQAVVILALVGVEGIRSGGCGSRSCDRLPVDALDGRIQRIDEGAHLRALVAAPGGEARLRDPDLRLRPKPSRARPARSDFRAPSRAMETPTCRGIRARRRRRYTSARRARASGRASQIDGPQSRQHRLLAAACAPSRPRRRSSR